jgi:hypothetical protein
MRGLLSKIIVKDESYSLTGSDIQSLIGYQPITYNQLENIDSVDQLFSQYGRNDSVVILYLDSWNSGHYTSLYRENNVIQFFDSYGFAPDRELQYVSFYIDQGGSPHLTRILNNARQEGYTIDHNIYDLQKKDRSITTCGIWCITRLKFRNLSHEQFYRLFTENQPLLTPDDLLVLLNYFSFYHTKKLI